MTLHRTLLSKILLILAVLYFPMIANANKAIDILIIAPHPDDETLGTAGVIMQALAQNKEVVVAVLTNGDGYALAASTITGVAQENLSTREFEILAKTRQQWLKSSLALIDFPEKNLHFLAYPDGGLSTIYNAVSATPYTNVLSGHSSTYATDIVDFHRQMFGESANYSKQAVLADLTHLIKLYRPKAIYVTSEADGHSDHQAAFWFTRDAAIAAGHNANLYTFMIHNGGNKDWPYPYSFDLKKKFSSHTVSGELIPKGVQWPPTTRMALTPEQAKRKLAMINQFKVEVQLDAGYMHAFAKSEEIFWQVPLVVPANQMSNK
jgi:LmbE family N-acetylglucosaminyl deacetylase